MHSAVEQAERELGKIDLVVSAGDVADQALAGRETIELARDADPDEALRIIRNRLMDIAGQN